ncbi:hypothetical protein AAHA92_29252 [Salvia divinorum]|uniref:Uncharacterized protein n=1 Tax=Salvia divinorum TaxID=28513 RepID=A0ABD1FYQ7_SALDI
MPAALAMLRRQSPPPLIEARRRPCSLSTTISVGHPLLAVTVGRRAPSSSRSGSPLFGGPPTLVVSLWRRHSPGGGPSRVYLRGRDYSCFSGSVQAAMPKMFEVALGFLLRLQSLARGGRSKLFVAT